MASRGCKHPSDAFCYICGTFIRVRSKKYSLDISLRVCHAYRAYFGMPIGDQDKSWAPHVCCEHCKKTLEGWSIHFSLYGICRTFLYNRSKELLHVALAARSSNNPEAQKCLNS